MKKLFFTLYFTAKNQDAYWLKIVPFVWHLIPTIIRNESASTKRYEWIDVWEPTMDYEEGWKYSINDFKVNRFCRIYGNTVILRFLCFEIAFIIKRLSEVGEIYPKGYNPETYDESVWIKYQRWKSLTNSEFFN